jgi:predicted GNAT family acetyltransferase
VWHTTGDLDEFVDTAGGFLHAHPAEHTIILSALDNVRGRGWPNPPTFGWWAADGGAVTSAYIWMPPYPAVVTGVPDEALPALAGILAEVPMVNAERTVAEAVTALWQPAGITTRVTLRTRLYRLGSLIPATPRPAGRARVADRADRDLVLEWYEAFLREVHDKGEDPVAAVDYRLGYGGFTLWETDEAAVSIAGRTEASAGMVRVGPVYTPPALRGYGYASAVTEAVSLAAQRIADEVLLFTDLANPTSNGIYQRLGYRPVHDRVVLARG